MRMFVASRSARTIQETRPVEVGVTVAQIGDYARNDFIERLWYSRYCRLAAVTITAMIYSAHNGCPTGPPRRFLGTRQPHFITQRKAFGQGQAWRRQSGSATVIGGGGTHRLSTVRAGIHDAMSLRGAWTSYLAVLDAWPFATKAATSAILAALGDALAQWIASESSLDRRRLVRFAITNAVLVAPTFHVWYCCLGAVVPGSGLRGALSRTLLDQLMFSPLFLFVFLTCVRSVGSKPLRLQPPSVRLWWTANCINWSVLPITQFINFLVVPVNLQVLFSNFVAVAMSAVMSYLTARG